MTSLTAAAADTSPSSLTARVGMAASVERSRLVTQRSRTLGCGRHRANNHVIPWFQLALQEPGHFSIGMVGDSQRDSDGFHGIVRAQLPDRGGLGFRRLGCVLGARGSSARRVVGCLLLLIAINSILLIEGQHFLRG